MKIFKAFFFIACIFPGIHFAMESIKDASHTIVVDTQTNLTIQNKQLAQSLLNARYGAANKLNLVVPVLEKKIQTLKKSAQESDRQMVDEILQIHLASSKKAIDISASDVLQISEKANQLVTQGLKAPSPMNSKRNGLLLLLELCQTSLFRRALH
jgi:hypothetical protein